MTALARATKDWNASRLRVGTLSVCWLVFAHALDAWSAGHGMLLTVIGVLLVLISGVSAHRFSVTFDALSKAEGEEAAFAAREREAVLATLREPPASTEGVDQPRVRVAAPEPVPSVKLNQYANSYGAVVDGVQYAYLPSGTWYRPHVTGQPNVREGTPLHALLEQARKAHEDAQAEMLRREEHLELKRHA